MILNEQSLKYIDPLCIPFNSAFQLCILYSKRAIISFYLRRARLFHSCISRMFFAFFVRSRLINGMLCSSSCIVRQTDQLVQDFQRSKSERKPKSKHGRTGSFCITALLLITTLSQLRQIGGGIF